MSISMVLQNFSPIGCFLHNKWAQNMAAKEKKEKKKIKKKVGKLIGDPVGGRDAPIKFHQKFNHHASMPWAYIQTAPLLAFWYSE